MGHHVLCLKHIILYINYFTIYIYIYMQRILKNKKKEILLFATTWMNLGDTMKWNNLDIERNITNLIYLWNFFFFFKVKLTVKESRMVITKGWGLGERGDVDQRIQTFIFYFFEYKLLVTKMNRFWRQHDDCR